MDSGNKGQELNSRNEGQELNSRNEGQELNSRNEGQELDSKIEGQELNSKNEGQELGSENEWQEWDSENEWQQWDSENEGQELVSEEDGRQEMPRAFQIEYIVEHLFGYLSLEDIKSCRLVGKVWRTVGDTFLRHNTRVVFFYPDIRWPNKREQTVEKLKTFNNNFNYYDEGEVDNGPYYSFYIGGYHIDSSFFDLCPNFGPYVKDLVVDFKSRQFSPQTYDMNLIIGQNLKSLCIGFGEFIRKAEGLNRFELTLDFFPCLEELLLDQCDISISEDMERIPLKKIGLGPNNLYTKYEDELDEFLINEIFDLSSTSYVKLMGGNIILDFADCTNRKIERKLFLDNITILNWEKCNWKVSCLKLLGISFVNSNLMEIEEIEIEDGIIDLSVIHVSKKVKKLWCSEQVEISQVEYLPNLVDVKLENNSISSLAAFCNNPDLVSLSLISKKADVTVNMYNFPINMKRLQLQSITVEGNSVVFLEKLVLRGYSFVDFEEIIRKFTAKCLVIFGYCCHRIESLKIIVNFLRHNNSFPRVLIGDFNWNEIGNDDSFSDEDVGFSALVDRKSFCYDFRKGQKGLGIDWEAFSNELYNK